MKVLLAHNFYGSSAPSGENTVFLAEAALLKEMGHDVVEFTRHSDEIRGRGACGNIKGALSTPWNPFSARRIEAVLRLHQPDVLHVHNFFPLLSPAIFHAAAGCSAATVLTLHNYRLFCAAGIPMRNGRACTLCLERKSVAPALRYGCYRNRRVTSAPMALMIALHRRLKTWCRHVDAFIALSDFQKKWMVKAGLPAERVYVKPHFYPHPPECLAWNQRARKIAFIGRLSEEKGVHLLIRAWEAWGEGAPELEIIGDGPLRDDLTQAVQTAQQGGKIIFKGQIAFEQTQRHLARTRLLVLPSLCFEGFPMAVREALALGVPVAASRIGPLPGIVADGKTGALFEPGNADDLLKTVRSLWENQDRLGQMAVAARQTFAENYTAEANYRTLMAIYEAAIRRSRRKS